VYLTVPLDDHDTDTDGLLHAAAIERIVEAARDAYFAECHTLRPGTTEMLPIVFQRGVPAAGNEDATVSAGVVEIFPDRFTMAIRVRVRPGPDDGGIAAEVRADFRVDGGVTDATRDEFIALAHGARHWH
jgi:hypothetical protein